MRAAEVPVHEHQAHTGAAVRLRGSDKQRVRSGSRGSPLRSQQLRVSSSAALRALSWRGEGPSNKHATLLTPIPFRRTGLKSALHSHACAAMVHSLSPQQSPR